MRASAARGRSRYPEEIVQLICQSPGRQTCLVALSLSRLHWCKIHSSNVKEFLMTADQKQLLADVEAFCQEIRPIEELCYVEHRFNDQVIPLARKYNLLGIPVPTAYGGRGSDTVTYARALARIG